MTRYLATGCPQELELTVADLHKTSKLGKDAVVKGRDELAIYGRISFERVSRKKTVYKIIPFGEYGGQPQNLSGDFDSDSKYGGQPPHFSDKFAADSRYGGEPPYYNEAIESIDPNIDDIFGDFWN
jgi:hypothetical protein